MACEKGVHVTHTLGRKCIKVDPGEIFFFFVCLFKTCKIDGKKGSGKSPWCSNKIKEKRLSQYNTCLDIPYPDLHTDFFFSLAG